MKLPTLKEIYLQEVEWQPQVQRYYPLDPHGKVKPETEPGVWDYRLSEILNYFFHLLKTNASEAWNFLRLQFARLNDEEQDRLRDIMQRYNI